MKTVMKRSRHRPNNRPHNNRQQQSDSVMLNDANFDHDERLDYRAPRNRAVLQQHIDKYLNQAREAISSGDRVAAENFLQHADHFNRLLNEQKEYRQQVDQKRQHQQQQREAAAQESVESAQEGASETTQALEVELSMNTEKVS